MKLTSFFKAALEASWQGSLVILLILLIRPLLGVRVPARWRYLLWTLVLVRLLVLAFVLPASPASLQNFGVVNRPFEQAGLALAPANENRAMPDRLPSQGPEQDDSFSISTGGLPAVKHSRSCWEIAALVWMCGAAAALFWILGAAAHLQRRLRQNSGAVDEAVRRIWERCCTRLSLRHPPRLLATGCIESPASLSPHTSAPFR